MTEDEVVSQLSSGMTIGIGGWGSRRKPMSIVRAIARSGLEDLTLVTYGGPDVGILCATGKVSRVVSAFVSLDSIALDPHFRLARQSGTVEEVPFDEGMMMLSLQAAAWRVPFLPTRSGLGTDLLKLNSDLRLVTSPYEDGGEFVAAPAIKMDAVICHLHRADGSGNAGFLGVDLYFDDLFLRAAQARRFVSVERVVPTGQLLGELGSNQNLCINRSFVDGIVERKGAAHFTDCSPDYGRDEVFQKEYAASAASSETFDTFRSEWIEVSEEQYQSKVASR
ncbi:MAG: CoA-transferase [Acidimicrobiales bacterium]